MTIGWCFDNTYYKLPDSFKENINPIPVKNPELIILNKNLADKLNLDFSNLDNKEISKQLSGNSLPKDSLISFLNFLDNNFQSSPFKSVSFM